METPRCLVCCPGCRTTKICLSAYSKYEKSENAVTKMIGSDPNKLSDCWTFSVGLGEKEKLQEDLKNSSGWLLFFFFFFDCLLIAPSYEQRNSTGRVGKPSSGDSRLWTGYVSSTKERAGTEDGVKAASFWLLG